MRNKCLLLFWLLLLTGCFPQDNYQKAVKIINNKKSAGYKEALTLLYDVPRSSRNYYKASGLIKKTVLDDVKTNYKDTLIAFISERKEFCVLEPATGKVRKYISKGYFGQPRWSPDGTKIVFSALLGNDYTYGVYLINRDGTGLMPLIHELNDDRTMMHPVWSKDGKSIIMNYQGKIIRYQLHNKKIQTIYQSTHEYKEAFHAVPFGIKPDKNYLCIYDWKIFQINEEKLSLYSLPYQYEPNLYKGIYQGITLSNQSNKTAFSLSRGGVIIYDPENQLVGRSNNGGEITWSPDDFYIILGSVSENLIITPVFMDSSYSVNSDEINHLKSIHVSLGKGRKPAWSPVLIR